MRDVTGWALTEVGGTLHRTDVPRRDPRPDDVVVRVTHCGVCHTDLHAVQGAGPGDLPLVPGHEFVGVVEEVGEQVTRFAVGDAVAVGNIVDSCGECASCREGEESYCARFPLLTYGGVDPVDGSRTLGGYATHYVVRERFTHALPAALDPAAAAPLMCAGITVWQPLRRYGVGPGSRVGVVGLGGLGHLAVKLARALGAQVTVFTTSAAKTADARAAGADHVVVSTDADAMAAHARTLDLVLDTASAAHDLGPYVEVLDMDGTLCMLGIPDRYVVPALPLLLGRRRLTASGSGGLRDTADLLAFAAEHGVAADVEVLPADRAQEALDRLARGDVAGRLVLAMPGA